MNLYGETVLLRAPEPEDNEMLRGMMNDPEIERMTGGWSFPVSARRQEEWLERQGNGKSLLRCTIVNEGGRAVGAVMLTGIDYKNGNAQIHLKIAKAEDRRRGYGSDAVRTLISYAFAELRLKCVYAQVSESNAASCAMFEKCGFERDGVLRCRLYKQGDYQSVAVYSSINPKV